VGKVDIAWFHRWPNVAVRFEQIKMESTWDEPLLDAKEVFILFNPLNLLGKDLSIETIEIRNATIHLAVDENKKTNYQVFKKGSDPSSESIRSIKILFSQVKLIYENRISRITQEYLLDEVRAKLGTVKDILDYEVSGKLTLNRFVTPDWATTAPHRLDLDLSGEWIGNENSKLSFAPSVISIDDENLNFRGDIDFNTSTNVDILITGENLGYRFLVDFLPKKYSHELSRYKGRGSINLDATISGTIGKNTYPAMKARFIAKKFSFEHPDFDVVASEVDVEGTLDIANLAESSSANLNITHFTGKMFDKPLSVTLDLKNFKNPDIQLKASSEVPLKWVLSTSNITTESQVEGTLNLQLDWVRKQSKNQINGIAKINEGSFTPADFLSIHHLNGKVLFKGNQFELQNVEGLFGHSRAVINGISRGWLDSLDSTDEPLTVMANIKSDFIDGNEIARLLTKTSVSRGVSVQPIRKKLDATLTVYTEKLEFLKFLGYGFNAEVTLSDHAIEFSNFSTSTIGGTAQGRGLLVKTDSGYNHITAHVTTKNIYLDSLFYIFNNFGQTFITNKFLKGRLFSEVEADMFFDNHWDLVRPTLSADAKLRIKEGQLNDFQPIMRLSKHINDKDDHLSRLKFGELVNYVHVAHDTVFIPEMSVRSNIRNIRIGGIHTLDQHIDYQLTVPARHKKLDKDELFGAVEQTSLGTPNLLFRIKGTAFDYKVKYDIGRAGKKFIERINLIKKLKKSKKNRKDTLGLGDDFFN